MYWRVSDVMTPDVVTASEGAPVGEIVDKLVTHRVSGLPIVDDGDRLVGVVSQADLLPRVAATRPAGGRTRRGRRAAKAAATSARQLMTAPALTIGADEPLSAAARKMQLKKVKRLLVTGDAGQLLGIVSRADLLRLYARADAAIRADVINHVLRRILWIDTRQVQVDVHAGVVTLSGAVGRPHHRRHRLAAGRGCAGSRGGEGRDPLRVRRLRPCPITAAPHRPGQL